MNGAANLGAAAADLRALLELGLTELIAGLSARLTDFGASLASGLAVLRAGKTAIRARLACLRALLHLLGHFRVLATLSGVRFCGLHTDLVALQAYVATVGHFLATTSLIFAHRVSPFCFDSILARDL